MTSRAAIAVASDTVGRPKAETSQLSFKIPNDLIRQAEELASLMPPLTKLDALRMAMARGLPLLIDERRALAEREPRDRPGFQSFVARRVAIMGETEEEAEAAVVDYFAATPREQRSIADIVGYARAEPKMRRPKR